MNLGVRDKSKADLEELIKSKKFSSFSISYVSCKSKADLEETRQKRIWKR